MARFCAQLCRKVFNRLSLGRHSLGSKIWAQQASFTGTTQETAERYAPDTVRGRRLELFALLCPRAVIARRLRKGVVLGCGIRALHVGDEAGNNDLWGFCTYVF
jgi:hypothetical protein